MPWTIEELKELGLFPKLYVGTMNDGLFIIDRPPRPAPKDYDTGITHQVNVIATMANNDREASKLADLFAASPALYEALKKAAAKFREYEHLHLGKGTHEARAKAVTNATMAELCEAALSAASPSQREEG